MTQWLYPLFLHFWRLKLSVMLVGLFVSSILFHHVQLHSWFLNYFSGLFLICLTSSHINLNHENVENMDGFLIANIYQMPFDILFTGTSKAQSSLLIYKTMIIPWICGALVVCLREWYLWLHTTLVLIIFNILRLYMYLVLQMLSYGCIYL